jgi:hypothetical protein
MPGISDDARRKLWLMRNAATEIERLSASNADILKERDEAIAREQRGVGGGVERNSQ